MTWGREEERTGRNSEFLADFLARSTRRKRVDVESVGDDIGLHLPATKAADPLGPDLRQTDHRGGPRRNPGEGPGPPLPDPVLPGDKRDPETFGDMEPGIVMGHRVVHVDQIDAFGEVGEDRSRAAPVPRVEMPKRAKVERNLSRPAPMRFATCGDAVPDPRGGEPGRRPLGGRP